MKPSMPNEQNAQPPDADWVMVPREATSEMMNRAVEAMHAAPRDWQGRQGHMAFRAGYEALLAAAPKPAAPRSKCPHCGHADDGPLACCERYMEPAAPGEDAVRALVAKWRGHADSEQGHAGNMEWAEWVREEHATRAKIFRCCARELEAITHPGHKHAQEDAAGPVAQVWEDGAGERHIGWTVEDTDDYPPGTWLYAGGANGKD